MDRLEGLALAIAKMEGWNPANGMAARNERNNNPGNLLNPSRTIYKTLPRDPLGFIIFPTPEAGWEALRAQIRVDAKRGLNLQQFINKYAPAGHGGNDPANYARFVGTQLGLTPAEVQAPIGSWLNIPFRQPAPGKAKAAPQSAAHKA